MSYDDGGIDNEPLHPFDVWLAPFDGFYDDIPDGFVSELKTFFSDKLAGLGNENAELHKRIEVLELTISEMFELNKIQRKRQSRWTEIESKRVGEIMAAGRYFLARDVFKRAQEQAAAKADAGKKCRVCGCMEFTPCDVPEGWCHWVEADLCSACAGKDSKC